MPPVAGWYVAVASARTPSSVTLSRGEVPRGALDSADGFVGCMVVGMGIMAADILWRVCSIPHLFKFFKKIIVYFIYGFWN